LIFAFLDMGTSRPVIDEYPVSEIKVSGKWRRLSGGAPTILDESV